MSKDEALALLNDRHATRDELETAAAEMEWHNLHAIAALLRDEARRR